MRLFRFANRIDMKKPSEEGLSNGSTIAVYRDIQVILNDSKSEGVAFVVGTRLTHKSDLQKDTVVLTPEETQKLGLQGRDHYRIRTTVPFVVSSLRLTEMPKEARGFVMGFDKRVVDFKDEFEKFLSDDENAVPADKLAIVLQPSLNINLKLEPGRGFGDISLKNISRFFSLPGMVSIPFDRNGEEDQRVIDFDRGTKKLIEILSEDNVQVTLSR